MTIKKTSTGFEVVSETTGKKLSKSNLSKAAAEKRLQQIEYFKHRDEGRSLSEVAARYLRK